MSEAHRFTPTAAGPLPADGPNNDETETHGADQLVTPIEWTGLRTQRVDYDPGATIFAQGDPATSVMYVEQGAVACQSCPTQERRP